MRLCALCAVAPADGLVDIVVGNYYGANQLLLNSGTAADGSWGGVVAQELPGGSKDTYALSLGDVNGGAPPEASSLSHEGRAAAAAGQEGGGEAREVGRVGLGQPLRGLTTHLDEAERPCVLWRLQTGLWTSSSGTPTPPTSCF